MRLSRRSILSGTAAAAGAGFLTQAGPSAKERPARASGLATGAVLPLRYESLEGFLGAEQLRWHHESHYAGALRGLLALEADPRGAHRARIAKANSVVLHELYFDNMSAETTQPGEVTQRALKARFGSVERWSEDFRAAALAGRGWTVLAFHPSNGKLYNVSSDSHDDGLPWCGVPLVVVDVYEHAYYLDFQNRKADYVDAFRGHVDWVEVESRLRRCVG